MYEKSFWIIATNKGYQALITSSGALFEASSPQGIIDKVVDLYRKEGWLAS